MSEQSHPPSDHPPNGTTIGGWRFFSRLLRGIGTTLLLLFVFSRVEQDQLAALIRDVESGWFLLALGFVLMAHLALTLGAKEALSGAGFSVPFGELWINHLRGLFVTQFLPTPVGADLYRIRGLHSGQEPDRWKSFAWILVMQRLIGLIVTSAFLLGGCAIADPEHFRHVGLVFLLALLIAGLIGIGGALFLGTVPDFIQRRLEPLRTLYGANAINRRATIWLISSSVTQLFCIMLAVWCAAHSLGLNLTVQQCCYLVAASLLAVVLPISLNGLGVREATYAFVLTSWGFSTSDAIALSLAVFLLGTVVAFAGGLTWLPGSRTSQHSTVFRRTT